MMDSSHIILDCSNCRAKLVDIFIKEPDAKKPDGEPFEWRAKALCCFCDDESFTRRFTGKFTYAGFSKEKDNGDDFDNYVKVTSVEKNLNEVLFKTAKGDRS